MASKHKQVFRDLVGILAVRKAVETAPYHRDRIGIELGERDGVATCKADVGGVHVTLTLLEGTHKRVFSCDPMTAEYVDEKVTQDTRWDMEPRSRFRLDTGWRHSCQ